MIFRHFSAPALLTASLLALTACGGSASLNPFGWFSSNGVEEVALIPEGGFLDEQDNRELVSEVIELEILRAQGGAIIRAKGLPPRLGYWNGELVPENFERAEDGVLTYMFRITEPYYRTQTGRPQQREVYVGHFVSDIKLQGVRTIRVVGANTSRSARR